MKKTVLAIGFALLTLTALAALAQDSRSNTITINGGKTTVSMKAPAVVVNHSIKRPASPFYDNIGSSGYNSGVGWTVSDGSPINTEYTPGNQIVSLKSGTTKKISVGVGFVTGKNEAIVDLTKDCKGVPCSDPDGKPKSKRLCQGKVENLPNFGSTGTIVVSFKCKAKLVKGKPYWVFVQSDSDSWLAWNLSLSATGGLIEGTNDVWGSPSSGQSVGALTIK